MFVESNAMLLIPQVSDHVSLQESAFRAATEKFATLNETAQTLAKQKSGALESAKTALEALTEAHTKATAAARELSSVEAQLSRTSTGFDGMCSHTPQSEDEPQNHEPIAIDSPVHLHVHCPECCTLAITSWCGWPPWNVQPQRHQLS
jgi:hypothetical protein